MRINWISKQKGAFVKEKGAYEMPEMIVYDENKKTFSLHTARTTYQFMIDRFGVLLHLYYGPKAQGNMEFLLTYADR